MEEKAFFTAKEREQLFALYKRLLQLSGDTLQKGDCHKLKIHLIKAVAEGNLQLNFEQPKVESVSRFWQKNFSPKWYMSAFPSDEINKGYGLLQNPGW